MRLRYFQNFYWALVIMLGSLFFLGSCSSENDPAKATGVFEAEEIIVSAEASGRLISFDLQEGQELDTRAIIGQIDTVQLALQKRQIEASQLSLEAGKPDISSQIKSTQREIEKLEMEKERTQRLLEGDVATQKQLDDILAQLDVLKARLSAQKKTLNSNVSAIDAQFEALEVQKDQLKDQIQRCKIKSPIDGTILVKYVERGEFVNIGKPLFKIANLNQLILRAYLTADQLKHISLNQEVKVLSEYGAEETKEYEGVITWISSKSEFTPKTIQTQDERANLVYAVKVAVENDGLLKIGMYAALKWNE